ncbi:MAG: 5-formyltetrahydrofolate cyclo-ligase [Termitinemataceae bacterium]
MNILSSETADSAESYKKILRSEMRVQLKRLPSAYFHTAGCALTVQIQKLPCWLHTRGLLLFASMTTEIDTDPLCSLALEAGKAVFYPAIYGDELEFYRVTRLEDLEPRGPLGIREPVGCTQRLEEWISTLAELSPDALSAEKGFTEVLETPPSLKMHSLHHFSGNSKPVLVALIPGLAFDRQGNRLGRGKGYYDRFLHRFTATIPSTCIEFSTIGVCTPLQLVDSVPVSTNDFPVDQVLLVP